MMRARMATSRGVAVLRGQCSSRCYAASVCLELDPPLEASMTKLLVGYVRVSPAREEYACATLIDGDALELDELADQARLLQFALTAKTQQTAYVYASRGWDAN